MELTILMPCLNEAKSLQACLERAAKFLDRSGIDGEIVVADNGSTDGSQQIAENSGARVVPVDRRGYGAALSEGIFQAHGKYVIMGDSDNSYNFEQLDGFVEKLREGYDLVMGNRFAGAIEPGAMPILHRYFGNPVLTALGRRIYNQAVCRDFYCGLRGFQRQAINDLHLQSVGMEFALEMIIKSQLYGLRISEVPTTLSPDQRGRAPHLRTFRDGWRSLRLYLLMSPRWTFGIPGLVTALIGVGLITASLIDLVDEPTAIPMLAIGGAAIILGYQSLLLAISAKFIAIETGLHPPATSFRFLLEPGTTERFLIGGAIVSAITVAYALIAIWQGIGDQQLGGMDFINSVALTLTILVLGGQTMLGGLYFGIIQLVAERRQFRRKRSDD